MTLREFNPTTIWYRSVGEPTGASFPAKEQLFPHEQPCDSEHLHNGDDWLALEGDVKKELPEQSTNPLTESFLDPITDQMIDVWVWDKKGNPCDFGRNRVFRIKAFK